jgi:hypothetical protein
LEYADCVSVTFEMQKKDEKGDTVTQIATGDVLLCPVRMWAAIVRRIWGYPGSTWDTKVSTIWNELFGWEKLNIKPGDIGTHSIRSGAAMAMYLGDIPVYSNDAWPLVERCLPPLHPKTGQTILP